MSTISLKTGVRLALVLLGLTAAASVPADAAVVQTGMYVIQNGAGCWNVRWAVPTPGETIQSYPCGWSWMGPEWWRYVQTSSNEIFQLSFQYTNGNGDHYRIRPLMNLNLCLEPRSTLDPVPPGQNPLNRWSIEQA